jgi:hypothetical protein
MAPSPVLSLDRLNQLNIFRKVYLDTSRGGRIHAGIAHTVHLGFQQYPLKECDSTGPACWLPDVLEQPVK